MSLERYASALQSRDLRHRAGGADVDALGAAALASRRADLAAAVLRMEAGDTHAGAVAMSLLVPRLVSYSKRSHSIDLRRSTAEQVAATVLAHRINGRCKSCSGSGFQRIPGAPGVSNHLCSACGGRGRLRLKVAPCRLRLAALADWAECQIEAGLDALDQGLRYRLHHGP